MKSITTFNNTLLLRRLFVTNSHAYAGGGEELSPWSPIEGILGIIGRCWNQDDVPFSTTRGMLDVQRALEIHEMDGAGDEAGVVHRANENLMYGTQWRGIPQTQVDSRRVYCFSLVAR